ncbi:MAG TPA: hypothetical protein VNV37_04465 [Solirubrobacteraceae bacterium]|jgi:hypothetical protein|nr:hypothetical protein [Solirubrobacteraceae bacterium]
MLSGSRHPDGLRARCAQRGAAERGSTLIELLVTLITGTIIMLALVAVLLFATRQETHLTDLAQATQNGRLAMTKLDDELHSACLAPSFTPIRQGSGSTELRFINAPGEQAAISKTEVNEHRIVWSEKAETLTDEIYPAAKEEKWPVFTYASTPSQKILLASHITKTSSTLPIFQYYGYASNASESATSGVSTLSTEPLISKAETLSEKKADEAASVLVSFSASSNASTTSLGGLGKDVSEPLQSQVTFSFSVPAAEAEKVDAPCQ